MNGRKRMKKIVCSSPKKCNIVKNNFKGFFNGKTEISRIKRIDEESDTESSILGDDEVESLADDEFSVKRLILKDVTNQLNTKKCSLDNAENRELYRKDTIPVFKDTPIIKRSIECQTLEYDETSDEDEDSESNSSTYVHTGKHSNVDLKSLRQYYEDSCCNSQQKQHTFTPNPNFNFCNYPKQNRIKSLKEKCGIHLSLEQADPEMNNYSLVRENGQKHYSRRNTYPMSEDEEEPHAVSEDEEEPHAVLEEEEVHHNCKKTSYATSPYQQHVTSTHMRESFIKHLEENKIENRCSTPYPSFADQPREICRCSYESVAKPEIEQYTRRDPREPQTPDSGRVSQESHVATRNISANADFLMAYLTKKKQNLSQELLDTEKAISCVRNIQVFNLNLSVEQSKKISNEPKSWQSDLDCTNQNVSIPCRHTIGKEDFQTPAYPEQHLHEIESTSARHIHQSNFSVKSANSFENEYCQNRSYYGQSTDDMISLPLDSESDSVKFDESAEHGPVECQSIDFVINFADYDSSHKADGDKETTCRTEELQDPQELAQSEREITDPIALRLNSDIGLDNLDEVEKCQCIEFVGNFADWDISHNIDVNEDTMWVTKELQNVQQLAQSEREITDPVAPSLYPHMNSDIYYGVAEKHEEAVSEPRLALQSSPDFIKPNSIQGEKQIGFTDIYKSSSLQTVLPTNLSDYLLYSSESSSESSEDQISIQPLVDYPDPLESNIISSELLEYSKQKPSIKCRLFSKELSKISKVRFASVPDNYLTPTSRLQSNCWDVLYDVTDGSDSENSISSVCNSSNHRPTEIRQCADEEKESGADGNLFVVNSLKKCGYFFKLLKVKKTKLQKEVEVTAKEIKVTVKEISVAFNNIFVDTLKLFLS